MPSDTPLLDELEKGPWPSFVKRIQAVRRQKRPKRRICSVASNNPIRIKSPTWKHGGIALGKRVMGAAYLPLYRIPEKFPNAEQMHTVRVNHPSGWFYTTKALRTICDIWRSTGADLRTCMDRPAISFCSVPIPNRSSRRSTRSPRAASISGDRARLSDSERLCRAGPVRVGVFRQSVNLIYDLTQTLPGRAPSSTLAVQVKIKASRAQ